MIKPQIGLGQRVKDQIIWDKFDEDEKVWLSIPLLNFTMHGGEYMNCIIGGLEMKLGG